MSRSISMLVCCLVASGCVSAVVGNAEPEPMNGWTRIEGPVDYDDGLLRGTLRIDALGDMKLATLTDTWKSRGLIISAERSAQAFSSAIVARTGCRPKDGVQGNGQGDLRMFLICN